MSQASFCDDETNDSCSGGSSVNCQETEVIRSADEGSSGEFRPTNENSKIRDVTPPMRCWLNLPLGGDWVEIEEAKNNLGDADNKDDIGDDEWNLRSGHDSKRRVERDLPLHQLLPLAARECIASAAGKTIYYAQLGIVEIGVLSGLAGFPKTSDFGTFGGYCYTNNRSVLSHSVDDTMPLNNTGNVTMKEKFTMDRLRLVQSLPPFSSLTWLDRQLVSEWRTISTDDLKGLIEVQNTLLKRVRHDPLSEQKNNNDTPNHRYEKKIHNGDEGEDDVDDAEYTRVRTLIPPPLPRPRYALSSYCYLCSVEAHGNPYFSSARRRHHCRLCGASICRSHGCYSHPLPELMYHPLLPERVCYICKLLLVRKDTSERIAWRLCRTRDYFHSTTTTTTTTTTTSDNEMTLSPYFTPGLDTVSDAAARLTTLTLAFSRKFPLFIGAQTTLAIETIDLLRKHGLNALFGFLLRKEFIQAAELLMRVVGIDRDRWPISWKEMTLGIFYALAAEKYRRGVMPDLEANMHRLRPSTIPDASENIDIQPYKTAQEFIGPKQGKDTIEANTNVVSINDIDFKEQGSPQERDKKYNAVDEEVNACEVEASLQRKKSDKTAPQYLGPGVCSPVSPSIISSCLLYAPIALSFLYADSEVDLQLLAAQQGWRVLYAHLRPLEYATREMASSFLTDTLRRSRKNRCSVDETTGGGIIDKPAYAVLIHEQLRVACWGVRGTASISDLVTDIRAIPIPFPEDSVPEESFEPDEHLNSHTWDVLPSSSRGMAVCGMARAATNLFHENLPIMEEFWRKGYKITITGHSLGGGIGALLGILMTKHWWKKYGVEGENVCSVFGYGTPACVDSELSNTSTSFSTTVVLHDDVIPRLTPTSIRKLLKQLMLVKKEWVDQHFEQDLTSVVNRAKKVWAPRFRGSFVLPRRVATAKEQDIGAQEQKPKKMKDFEEKILKTENYSNIESLFESSDEDTGSLELENMKNRKKSLPDVPSSSNDEPFKHNHVSSPEFCGLDDVDGTDILVLGETPLPKMYVPGRIIHIYSDNGAYKATFVPRSFKALRRISLAGNMLTDHTARAYYESLLEVKSVSEASTGGVVFPRWASYEESSACFCCASRFTWASTSDSEAQEARDKHNCRSCGQLVCDPCSRNRISLPRIGINALVRICDRCYYNLSGVTRFI